MTREDQQFDPTHVLVLTTSDDSSTEASETKTAIEANATKTAVEAILDYADSLVLSIDVEALAGDHPEIAHQLKQKSNSIEEDILRASPEKIHSPLSDLLSLTSFHRFVTLERIDAFRNDKQILHYVPDHRRFEINAGVDDQLETAIKTAIENEPAGLLPATVLADWYENDTHYKLEPPSLCANNACFSLSQIDNIEFNKNAREIQISWSTGVMDSIIDLIRTSRPTHFQFNSSNRYDTIADALRDVAVELNIET